MARTLNAIKIVAVNLGVLLLLMVMLEGFSSYYFLFRGVSRNEPLVDRVHTEYDEQLGWINLPNLRIEDMYGPGIYLTTNSQRFRNPREFPAEAPANQVRAICSGDSFTLGYGVDDDHTWCQLLANRSERLETVNMGQSGYGVDQAYLWYKRNEAEIEHDIHLFAFIAGDFLRVQSDTFLGYGKPFLALEDGELLIANEPVPQRSYHAPWLTADLKEIAMLDTVGLLNKVYNKLVPRNSLSITQRNDQTELVVSRMFEDLQLTSQANQATLVLVFLPILEDYLGLSSTTKHWREYVRAEAENNGYLLVDVVEELRKLPPLHVQDLFDGHYSAEGNRFVADVIFEKVVRIPELSSVVSAGGK